MILNRVHSHVGDVVILNDLDSKRLIGLNVVEPYIPSKEKVTIIPKKEKVIISTKAEKVKRGN